MQKRKRKAESASLDGGIASMSAETAVPFILFELLNTIYSTCSSLWGASLSLSPRTPHYIQPH